MKTSNPILELNNVIRLADAVAPPDVYESLVNWRDKWCREVRATYHVSKHMDIEKYVNLYMEQSLAGEVCKVALVTKDKSIISPYDTVYTSTMYILGVKK